MMDGALEAIALGVSVLSLVVGGAVIAWCVVMTVIELWDRFRGRW